MKQQNFIAPIVMRYVLFIINIYFSIQMTSAYGWSFLSILLILFATRDFVHATRLVQIYYYLKKNSDKQDKQ